MEKQSIIVKVIKTCFLSIAFIASWIIIIAICFGNFFIQINLIGDKDTTLNIYDEYFENGYDANVFGINISNFVKTSSNINNKKLGNYQVIYSFDYILGRKEVVRNINVIDDTAPVISLEGEKITIINKYYNYEEAGYSANDNLDGDITDRVKVESNVNTSVVGSYEISYTVVDDAGNKTVEKRSVEVVENNILSSSVEDFRLNGLFGNVMLPKIDVQETYMKDAVIVGDSNIRYLYLNGRYLEGNQVWGKNNLNAGDINTAEIIIHDTNEHIKVIDALKKYKPKYMIVSFGITSTSFLTKEVFIDNVSKFFETVKRECPDTKLIVVSILPVSRDYAVLMSPINKYNYYLLELCDKYKIGYINVTDALKSESGYGAYEYFSCNSKEDCGYHLSSKGKEFYVNYLKSIDLSKEIK